ncbi:MAG: AsmA family protein [Zoogloeaceae bacterium]|nr:AsmA family protein [Zoogloeaceae bacterium]
MSESGKYKRLWWSLGLVGAVLLAAVLIAFIFSFDGERLKQGLIEQVRAEKQRELRIDGPLRLKLLPRLSVETQAIRLSNREGKGEFLRLGRVSGALEILPLLTGRIVINRIEIRDWSLQIERDAEGRYNFDDLLVSTEDDSAPLDLEVEKLLLLNGEIHWRDATSGGELTAEQVYLRSDHLGRQAHGRLEMGGNLRGGATGAHLGFALETLYRLDGAAQTLQLDQARLSLKGQGYGMERARLNLSARYVHGDLQKMALDLVQLHVRGEGERQGASLTGELDLNELHWQAAVVPRLKKLSASLNLKQAVDKANVRLTVDGIRAQDGEASNEGLRLDWQGEWQKQGYKGEIASPVVLEQDDKGFSLRADAVQGRVQIAAGATFSRALDVRLDGKLAFNFGLEDEARGAGELHLAQDDSKLDARWQLLHGQPSRLTFQASLDQLNLDQYLRADTAVTTGTAVAAQEPPPEVAVAGNAEAELEIDGTMRVGMLQYKGLRMENLESRLSLKQGRLEMVSGAPPAAAIPPAPPRRKR